MTDRPHEWSRHDWLTGGSHPEEIGGRAVDVSQIPESIELLVKAAFPVNGVPPEVITQIEITREICGKAEELLADLVELVSLRLEDLER